MPIALNSFDHISIFVHAAGAVHQHDDGPGDSGPARYEIRRQASPRRAVRPYFSGKCSSDGAQRADGIRARFWRRYCPWCRNGVGRVRRPYARQIVKPAAINLRIIASLRLLILDPAQIMPCFTGSARIRLPVAAKMALHKTGATGGTGGFADAAPEIAARHPWPYRFGRVGHAQHLIVVEIRLIGSAVLDGDLAVVAPRSARRRRGPASPSRPTAD